jgi:hypothetical protein
MAETVAAPAADTPKRGRKAAKPGDNLVASDEALKSQLAETRKLYLAFQAKVDEQRKASGTYRSALKIAVALGKHFDLHASDVTKLMTLMDVDDPEDIDRETRRLNRLCKLAGLPIGAQLGLFDEDGEPQSVADITEREKIALTGGAASFKAGMQLVDCPYPDGHELRDAWIAEWSAAAEQSLTKPNRKTQH